MCTPSLVADYRMPPAYDLAAYPGHAAREGHTFQHALRMIARLFLLYELARITPSVRNELVKSLVDGSATLGAGSAKQARILGPKVVAIPSKLSDGEYAAVATRMWLWCIVQSPRSPARFEDGDKWNEVVAVNAQGRSSPALMRWKAQ